VGEMPQGRGDPPCERGGDQLLKGEILVPASGRVLCSQGVIERRKEGEKKIRKRKKLY